jgi:hypothetical protein
MVAGLQRPGNRQPVAGLRHHQQALSLTAPLSEKGRHTVGQRFTTVEKLNDVLGPPMAARAHFVTDHDRLM